MITFSYTKTEGYTRAEPSYMVEVKSDLAPGKEVLGTVVKSTVTTPVGEFPCWKFVSAREGLEHAERKTQKDVKTYVEGWVLDRIASEETVE